MLQFGCSLFFVCFLLLHILLMNGLFLEHLREKRLRNDNHVQPVLVSIIIPVHNEANRINPLLESLLHQDYPSIQIIFIDDRSSDETPALLAGFKETFQSQAEKTNIRSCKIITLEANQGPNYKQFALIRGFAEVEGELILLTDADCELPSTWVNGMVRRFADSATGIIVGPVFKKIPRKTFLYHFQAFDHAIRYMYLVGSIGLGATGGGFGNNMAVRKAALDAAGGYASVPFSVTEDAALISHVSRKTEFKVRAGIGQDIMVMTETEQTWMQCIVQLLRWTKGGLFSSDIATKLSFSILMGMISLGILAIPLLPFVPALWPLPLAVYIAMLMNTMAILAISGNALKPLGFLDLLLQLIVEPIVNTFLTLMVIFRVPIYWKGKKV